MDAKYVFEEKYQNIFAVLIKLKESDGLVSNINWGRIFEIQVRRVDDRTPYVISIFARPHEGKVLIFSPIMRRGFGYQTQIQVPEGVMIFVDKNELLGWGGEDPDLFEPGKKIIPVLGQIMRLYSYELIDFDDLTLDLINQFAFMSDYMEKRLHPLVSNLYR